MSIPFVPLMRARWSPVIPSHLVHMGHLWLADHIVRGLNTQKQLGFLERGLSLRLLFFSFGGWRQVFQAASVY